jgi:hypothetical protein
MGAVRVSDLSGYFGTQRFYHVVDVPGLSYGVESVKIRASPFCTFILYKVHLHATIDIKVDMSNISVHMYSLMRPLS